MFDLLIVHNYNYINARGIGQCISSYLFKEKRPDAAHLRCLGHLKH